MPRKPLVSCYSLHVRLVKEKNQGSALVRRLVYKSVVENDAIFRHTKMSNSILTNLARSHCAWCLDSILYPRESVYPT